MVWRLRPGRDRGQSSPLKVARLCCLPCSCCIPAAYPPHTRRISERWPYRAPIRRGCRTHWARMDQDDPTTRRPRRSCRPPPSLTRAHAWEQIVPKPRASDDWPVCAMRTRLESGPFLKPRREAAARTPIRLVVPALGRSIGMRFQRRGLRGGLCFGGRAKRRPGHALKGHSGCAHIFPTLADAALGHRFAK